jgi:outer membrane murein-binding lipoprotein Lpp
VGYQPLHKPAPDAKLAAMQAVGQTDPATSQAPRRGTRVLLIAMIVVLAVNFGAVLGIFGWNVLQALGVVEAPAIETAQRAQGAAIAELDTTVQALSAKVSALIARVDAVAGEEGAASRRMTEIETGLGDLRTSVNDLRGAGTDGWREPVAELTATATRARTEMLKLRASIDEMSEPRRRELADIGARLDRIEQAMAKHNLLSSMRGSIQEPHLSVPRPVAVRAKLPAADDGHIINLAPAE